MWNSLAVKQLVASTVATDTAVVSLQSGTEAGTAASDASVVQYTVAQVDPNTGQRSMVQYSGAADVIALQQQVEALVQQLHLRDAQLQEQAQHIAGREGQFHATAQQYRLEARDALDHMEVKTIQERSAADQAAP